MKKKWLGLVCQEMSKYIEIIQMGLLEDMTRRVKKLGIIDLKLAQCAAMFFALVIAKLIPEIMDLSIWWFAGLLVICAIKPFYVFWFMK